MLIWSWAELIYQEGNVLDGFKATSRTYDLVPAPAAYLLQKMVINRERKPDKSIKDQRVIDNILSYIYESFELTEELKRTYEPLTTKQKKKINEYCELGQSI